MLKKSISFFAVVFGATFTIAQVPEFGLTDITSAVEDTGTDFKTLMATIVGLVGIFFLAYAAIVAWSGEQGEKMKKLLLGGLIGLVCATILYVI